MAKRNFRRRHHHDGDNSLSGSDSLDDESAKMTTISGKSCHSVMSTDEPEAKRSKLISSGDDDVETTTDSSKSSSDKGEIVSGSKRESPDPNPAKNTEPIVDKREADFSTVKASARSTSDLERLEQWAELLDERPITNDSNAMSAWIEKVLKVSEPGQAKKENTCREAVRSANDVK